MFTSIASFRLELVRRKLKQQQTQWQRSTSAYQIVPTQAYLERDSHSTLKRARVPSILTQLN